MSALTLATRDLVRLLADAILTAGADSEHFPEYNSVVLDTAWADVEVASEDEDGPALMDTVPSDVLVATSTNGFTMVGQGHCPCSGRLHKPIRVSVMDAQAVVKTFTAKGKSAPKGIIHQTLVEVSGDRVTVSEDPDQHPGGVQMLMTSLDLDVYPRNTASSLGFDPTRPVFKPMTPGDDPEAPRVEIPPSHGSGLSGAAFEIIGKVSKARKMPPRWYRYHQHRGVIAEVGSMWKAYFQAQRLEEDRGEHLEPQVPVFSPRIPERDVPEGERAPQPDLLSV